jgi:pimeloyl-ACP methyl ester carboxylesterase
MTNFRKYFQILFFALIFLIIITSFAINYAIKNVLPYAPIRPYRVNKTLFVIGHKNLENPSSIGLKYSDFNITVEDTIKLKGWFIYSQLKPAHGTIFILHGISNCKNAMLPLARILCCNGFNCACYDLRANGESGGLNCTFGYYEKKDLSKYIDSAIVQFPNSAPYGIFGHSLGAAVALQAMAMDKRIECGIAVSPFADLRTIIRDYFARISLIRINSIPDRALIYTEQIARFQIDSVRPAESAKEITQPVMIIHGLADKNISPVYGKEVYNNLSSKDKYWYPIPGGGHNDLPSIGGEEYNERITEFYKKYLVK